MDKEKLRRDLTKEAGPAATNHCFALCEKAVAEKRDYDAAVVRTMRRLAGDDAPRGWRLDARRNRIASASRMIRALMTVMGELDNYERRLAATKIKRARSDKYRLELREIEQRRQERWRGWIYVLATMGTEIEEKMPPDRAELRRRVLAPIGGEERGRGRPAIDERVAELESHLAKLLLAAGLSGRAVSDCVFCLIKDHDLAPSSRYSAESVRKRLGLKSRPS